MNGLKAKGKTIGEVEKLTEISKRDLKYFMEQGLFQPSQKSESGYWLYSGEDIKKAQLAALCRELDIPVRTIRVILADPYHHWQQELERQIIRLTEKKARTEAKLSRAEALLLNWKTEEWASLISL
jgi:DNA-binding transcriptional MerR regulator